MEGVAQYRDIAAIWEVDIIRHYNGDIGILLKV